jgi:hypothetical protein
VQALKDVLRAKSTLVAPLPKMFEASTNCAAPSIASTTQVTHPFTAALQRVGTVHTKGSVQNVREAHDVVNSVEIKEKM